MHLQLSSAPRAEAQETPGRMSGGAEGKASKTRGSCWRRKEVLDLLALWEKMKVQEQLWQTCRNIDTSGEIAKKMATSGHCQTGEECSSKTKGLHLDYK